MAPPDSNTTRRDTDAGVYGDKVAAFDPATVPLGTWDEAAGAEPERSDPPPAGPPTKGIYAGKPLPPKRGAGLVAAIIVAFVVLAVGVLLMMR